MNNDQLSTDRKALQINRDADKYGTFAEIGAGQEVARWFFHVGGAAGTVAKTISAYDMAVSDAIYGPTERYVSRQRLQAMLQYEFDLLLQRLDPARGGKTNFFVFADTVATRSFTRQEEGGGWLGIRFQTRPREAPSEIIIHVRMLDKENARQQEALGVIGVNLIHGAFYLHRQPDQLIHSLLDNLTWERVEVDMIRFGGPAFAGVDNRLMALQLVEQDLTEAAMFKRFEQDEVVFNEGEPANRFYLICQGKIALESRGQGGLAPLVLFVGEDEVVGWSWLFPPYYWHFSARAVEPTNAIFFYGTRLREQCEEDPVFGYELMKRVAAIVIKRLQIARVQLLQLQQESPPSLR